MSDKAIKDVVLYRAGTDRLELVDEDGMHWELVVREGHLVLRKSEDQYEVQPRS